MSDAEPDPRDELIALLRDAIRLLRRAALGLALAWALLATIGCVALLSQSSADRSALARAEGATSSAARAVRRADMAITSARTANRQSSSANKQSVSTQQLAAAIQGSRLQACLAQNAQHRKTISALGELYATAGDHVHTPAQQAALHRSQRAVTLVFDASTPHRDCSAVVGPP